MNNVIAHSGYALAEASTEPKCSDGIGGKIKRFYTQYETEGKCSVEDKAGVLKYAKDCKDELELKGIVAETSKSPATECKLVEKPSLLRIGGTVLGVTAAGYGVYHFTKKGKKSKR